MDMSINQRLERFLFEKKLSQEELRIRLGLKTRQQVNNWINCQDSIPDKHLIAILKAFPELNANWLIRGIGAIFMDQKQLRQINRNEYVFCEDCLDKEKEIARLKEQVDKYEKELKDMYRETGKLEERLSRYEKKKS